MISIVFSQAKREERDLSKVKTGNVNTSDARTQSLVWTFHRKRLLVKSNNLVGLTARAGAVRRHQLTSASVSTVSELGVHSLLDAQQKHQRRSQTRPQSLLSSRGAARQAPPTCQRPYKPAQRLRRKYDVSTRCFRLIRHQEPIKTGPFSYQDPDSDADASGTFPRSLNKQVNKARRSDTACPAVALQLEVDQD